LRFPFVARNPGVGCACNASPAAMQSAYSEASLPWTVRALTDPERKLHESHQTQPPEVGRGIALLRRAVAVQRAGTGAELRRLPDRLRRPAGPRVRRLRPHVVLARRVSLRRLRACARRR